MLHLITWCLVPGALISSGLLNLCSGCPDKLDLVFAVDSSSSIDYLNFQTLKNFLVQVTDRFPIGYQNTRVAVVRFSDYAEIQWNLDSQVTATKESLTTWLQYIPRVKGKTHTSHALDIIANYVLGGSGDREEVDNLVIVITDGKSNLGVTSLEQRANTLKQMTRVMAIGVTDKVDRSELSLIASSDCDVFHVDSFDAMDDNMDATMDQICGCAPGYMSANDCGCLACPQHTYQPDWGHTQCMDCPGGTHTLQGAAEECVVACEAGQWVDVELGICSECPRGTYQSATYSETCVPCPSGTSTVGEGSSSENYCNVTCSAGQYYNTTTGVCMLCPQGTYQPEPYSLHCELCDSGLNTVSPGATNNRECIFTCGPGEEISEATEECVLCQTGYYQPNNAGVECDRCPDGTTTTEEGATSQQQCTGVSERVSEEEESGSNGWVAGVVVAVLVLIAGVALLLFFLLRRRRRNREPQLSNLFIVPVPDKGHIYKDPSIKGKPSTHDVNAYDNPLPQYDTPSKQPRPLSTGVDDNGEPVYSNAGDYITPANVAGYSGVHEYSNAEAIRATANATDGGGQGWDNLIYENHEEIKGKL